MRPLTIAVAALCLSLSCQSVSKEETREAEPPESTIAWPTEQASSTLTFPPPPDARHPREELAPRRRLATSGSEPAPVEIESPALDEDRHFEFAGQRLRIEFSRRTKVAKGSSKPALNITPAVAGTIRWSSPWTLVFDAEQPFDPEQRYTVALGEIEDEAGNRVAEGWSATFRADPQIWLASKLITYIPEPGRPRVVATSPYDEATVGARPELQILFDQGVTVADVAELIELVDAHDDSTIMARLSHPAKGRFDGHDVDRKHIVVVQPASKLDAGRRLKLKTRDAGAKAEDAQSREYVVAEPLRFTELECGYGSDVCERKDDVLRTSGNRVRVVFNNPLAATRNLARRVHVSPPVRNLSAWADSWSAEGRLDISGAFEPSTRYEVSIDGLEDRYGDRQGEAATFTLETTPLTASASIPEGIRFYDAAASRTFAITTRNVEDAELRLWKVSADEASWNEAQIAVSNRKPPEREPDVELKVSPQGPQNESVTTQLDLLEHVEPGSQYLASIDIETVAHDAPRASYPSYSWAARPPVALLTLHDERALAVHARATLSDLLVHVAKLHAGTPVEGARLFLDGNEVAASRTDASGFVRVPLEADIGGQVLEVVHDDVRSSVSLSRDTVRASALVPELTRGTTPTEGLRGLVMTDRGVYRPGATIHFKASVRQPDGAALRTAAYAPVHLVVLAPSGKTVLDVTGVADDMGSFATDWVSDSTAEIGRYRAIIKPLLLDQAIAETIVQIAEFEPPRFTVDVTTKLDGERRVKAEVLGRYLFGASMSEAEVQWSLRRSGASVPSNPFSARGLRFASGSHESWIRTGTGTLDAKGILELVQQLDLDDSGAPQSFTLEAQVTDESHRAIAGRDSIVVHPAERYVGLKLDDHWLEVGRDVPMQLGVVDTEGTPVEGVRIEVELYRRTWKRSRKPGPGGSTYHQWHEVVSKEGSCRARSAAKPTSCALKVPKGGDYEVRASIDGRPGPKGWLWAWGGGGDDELPAARPGHELQLTLDAKRYRAGDTAKVRVRNPFKEATAIFTVERAGVRTVETRRLSEPQATFEAKLEALDAPGVHATVTLLPIGAEDAQAAQWKFGAVELPVGLEGMRLGVQVSSDRPHYEPGERATLSVKVEHDGKPVAGADVALAVVDEGVLRLTNFHAPDPVDALWPKHPLDFAIADTRRAFAQMLERSHVAGDGGGDEPGGSLVATRKNFVRTALWKPQLRTNAQGEVQVDLELPDNLTRFRMMAVVLDDEGRGGSVENDFEVRKPLMLVPAVPRFATLGDRFDAAVLAHNNTEQGITATVSLGDERRQVELAARSRARVNFPVEFDDTGEHPLVFTILDGDGVPRDRVEAVVPVQGAGIETRPRLAGRFDGAQDVLVQVPADVFTDARADDHLTITLGSNLWPELGARLEFLLGYPHGCVEQTTSGTLPLLAARDILPRIGVTRWTRSMLDERAESGLKRLASMKTPSGGLAYWPGGWEPNVYGTAYAMRAITLATRQGLNVPGGLLEDTTQYLQQRLTTFGPTEHDAEVMSSVALALAEADALEVSTADMLYDSVPRQGVFGLANLALALERLPDQDERVSALLDHIEAAFDSQGALTRQGPEREYLYYGSTLRTQAQAALALVRLRPSSPLLPTLVDILARSREGYTTQATAFGLLALREHIALQSEGSGELRALLDGVPLRAELADSLQLGPHAKVYRIDLDDLKGSPHRLRLESTSSTPVSFLLHSRWRRALEATDHLAATSADHGPEIYRAYSTPKGEPIDPRAIEAGQTVRVTILAELPTKTVDRERLGYLAITDRIPAGFEPVQPDLWTVARVEGLSDVHPWYDLLRWGHVEASHVELRDDRVHLYFDRLWGSEVVGSYLLRATTPGLFIAAPTMAELMYEPNSVSYGDAVVFEVKR